ncbi:hypothetical protein EGW08_009255 [Elysia chlorotica]|uniref:G-protein coupled receptors family 1 profile domain-containing protein n=1 Tax=Elysia chlorotica TaxID=188477 RepID=A0A3S0ZUC0_ELYCH|nr:hypothetical protein EGW08_009255 [Elysia chlorotica]
MAIPMLGSTLSGANILLIVILSILFTNAVMIYKVLGHARKKVWSSNRAKHVILILQGVGDILVGLFPLNIRYQSFLGTLSLGDIACWQRVFAHTFLFHVMPLVHAAGILLLVVESALFWRRGGRHSSGRRWCSPRYLAAAFTPWALGLLVAVPLVLLGFDFHTCSVKAYSLPVIQSFYWVTIICPGILALVAACAFSTSSLQRADKLDDEHFSYAFISGDPCASPSSVIKSGLPPCRESVHTKPEETLKTPEMEAGVPKPQFAGKIQNYASYHLSKFWKTSNKYSQNLEDNTDLVLLDGRSRGVVSAWTLTDGQPTLRWEKWTRLAAAALFCACSVPYAAMDLTLLYCGPGCEWSSGGQASGVDILYRLLVLRSLISPLVWIHEYN